MGIYLFDLILLVVLTVCGIQGYRRGFILTFCSFLAIFIALIGATALSNHLCQPVGKLMQPVLEAQITKIFQDEWHQTQFPSAEAPPIEGTSSTEAQNTMQPQITLGEALDILKSIPVLGAFWESVQQAVDEGVSQALGSAAELIAAQLAKEIARILLFILGFLLIFILWLLLSHALDLAFRLPVLSTVNAVAGLCVGLVKGCLLAFILAWLLSGLFLTQETIEQTVLLRFFSENSPVSLLFSLIQK